MNARERVICALDHKEPDRTPIDLGGGPTSGIAASLVYQLRRAYGLPEDVYKRQVSSNTQLVDAETAAGLADGSIRLEEKKNIEEPLKAPITEGQQVGSVSYLLNGQELYTAPLIAGRDVYPKGEAVSYTHLDVYKRQDSGSRRHRRFAPFGRRVRCDAESRGNHLDVYKRQR